MQPCIHRADAAYRTAQNRAAVAQVALASKLTVGFLIDAAGRQDGFRATAFVPFSFIACGIKSVRTAA